jgi:hypothetical protein
VQSNPVLLLVSADEQFEGRRPLSISPLKGLTNVSYVVEGPVVRGPRRGGIHVRKPEPHEVGTSPGVNAMVRHIKTSCHLNLPLHAATPRACARGQHCTSAYTSSLRRSASSAYREITTKRTRRPADVRTIGTIRLGTRAALAEACATYERNGFERVDALNDEPYSDRLASAQQRRELNSLGLEPREWTMDYEKLPSAGALTKL